MTRLYTYMVIMAVVTYLIRMLPLVLFRRQIRSPLVQSFLYYVPFAALAAMTFPEILYSTDSMISGGVGFVVALVLAYRRLNMVTVAVTACGVVFATERLLFALT